MVEIFRKLSQLDSLFQISIRGSNDPCIDTDGFGPAHPLKFFFLEKPEER